VKGRPIRASLRNPRRQPRPRDYVNALGNGLQVIECFSAATPALTIADVAGASNLTRAAARRYLLTLTTLGYMDFDGKYYRLSTRTARLGYAYFSTAPLPKLAQPILERVADITQEGVSLAVLDGLDVIYIGRSSARRIMSSVVGVGVRIPAVIGGTGRVMLASKPDEWVVRMLRTIGTIPPLTAKTKTNRDDVLEEIRRARQRGFSINHEEVEIGLRSIAAPVRNATGSTIAAMSVSTPTARLSATQLVESVLPVLTEACRDLGMIV
jgi:IclR family pca regulon transcriptional regulator